MKAFTFITDPGHGWLKVPRKELFALGLNVTDFTPYSYKSRAGTTYYLEEDCDAPKFIAAWKAKNPNASHFPMTERYVNRFDKNLPSIY